MQDDIEKKILQELENPTINQKKHFQKCLLKADGNEEVATRYYLHQRLAENKTSRIKYHD